MFEQVFILTFIFGNSLAIQPSAGCGKTLPDSPKPGEHHRFFFEHNDVLLGAIERDFIVQIPKDFDNTSPIPLLFDVHWYAGSAPKQGTIHILRKHLQGRRGTDKETDVSWDIFMI